MAQGRIVDLFQQLKNFLSEYKDNTAIQAETEISAQWHAINNLITTENSLDHLSQDMQRILRYQAAFHQCNEAFRSIFITSCIESLSKISTENSTDKQDTLASIQTLLQNIALDSTSFFEQLYKMLTAPFEELPPLEPNEDTPVTSDSKDDVVSVETNNTENEGTSTDNEKITKLKESPKWVAVQTDKSRSRRSFYCLSDSFSEDDLKKEKRRSQSFNESLVSIEPGSTPPQSKISDSISQLKPSESESEVCESHIPENESPTSKFKKKSKSIFRMTKRDSNADFKRTKSRESNATMLESGAILPILKELEKTDEICFDYNPIEPDMPTVRYGTIEKLIERLTLPNLAQDMHFRKVFFLTFPSFTNVTEVIRLLEDRLLQAKDGNTEQCSQIILRIVASLKTWIEYYPDDFKPGTPIRKKTEELIEIIGNAIPGAATLVQTALPVCKDIEKSLPRRSRALRLAPAIAIEDFSVLEPGRICFSALNSLEVARQFTSMAASIYSKLKPQEFAKKNWCREERYTLSPNIMKIVEQFNKLSQWAMTEILKPIQLKERVKILRKVIEVAQHFREFNNFHGFMAILSALQSSPVKRLHQTWAEINEEQKAFIDESLELMSFMESYKNYRTLLKSFTRFDLVLPFIGIFLTDLVYIEDGNPTFLAPGKINFMKFKLIASVTEQILNHRSNYEFTEIPAIFQWFSEFEVIEEEEAYTLSMKLEPRDKSEALETLLLTEANLRKALEEAKVQNDILTMREKEHAEHIELLNTQLREQRRVLTIASDNDGTLLKRYSIKIPNEEDNHSGDLTQPILL